jgi:hypothetical protein
LIEGQREHCGFYKTEYVWADTDADAAEKAKSIVARRLETAASGGDASRVRMEVESAKKEGRLWKALSSPGFAFYKDDAQGAALNALH